VVQVVVVVIVQGLEQVGTLAVVHDVTVHAVTVHAVTVHAVAVHAVMVHAVVHAVVYDVLAMVGGTIGGLR